MSLRVLVVDDSVLFRRIIADALANIPGVEVIGTAANGRLALSRVAALKPDLITLDVEMPELNGIEVLEQMKLTGLQTGAIVLSSHTTRGGELTVKALELGAFDFLTKPEGGTPQENSALLHGQLAALLEAFSQQHGGRGSAASPVAQPTAPEWQSRTPPARLAPARGSQSAAAPIVLIGVSTGGPVALASIVPALPGDLNAPVLIVQHMPPLFTKPLAASLARKSKIPVKEASDGELALCGHAYLAPGGSHMKVGRGARGEVVLRITNDPPENNCRPAVDYLFRSAALHFPGRSIAVVLTGMGRDGTLGLRLLKRGGCATIAQDEASCVVFGMPKEAIQAGVIDTVAPLGGIPDAIIRAVREARA